MRDRGPGCNVIGGIPSAWPSSAGVASRNITVNTAAPWFIETDMTAVLPQDVRDKMLAAIPLKRMGRPEDAASAVRFQASDEAAYIAGHVVNVNGGMYIWALPATFADFHPCFAYRLAQGRAAVWDV
jgi:hypothetical protein